jgi:hypothetical protein
MASVRADRDLDGDDSMNDETNHSLRNLSLSAAAVLALGVVVWVWIPNDGCDESTKTADRSGPPESAVGARPAEEHRSAAAHHPESETQQILAARYHAPQSRQQLASDGNPIMGARGDSTKHGPRHPHPITAEHQRIFRENALISSLNGAMDVEDFRGLRELNERYKTEYPEDPNALQAGYDLIADCLEERTPENRARAERYFAEERASTLRRYVRRHCLK